MNGQKVYDPEKPGYIPYCTCAGPFPEVGIEHEPHCLLTTHPEAVPTSRKETP